MQNVKYKIGMSLCIAMIAIASSCYNNHYKVQKPIILRVSASDGEVEVMRDLNSLEWAISNINFTLKPFFAPGHGIGVTILPKEKHRFVLSGIQIRLSDLSAYDAENKEPQTKSDLGFYYYSLQETKQQIEFISPITIESECETGLCDARYASKVPKFIVFDLEIQSEDIKHRIKIVSRMK